MGSHSDPSPTPSFDSVLLQLAVRDSVEAGGMGHQAKLTKHADARMFDTFPLVKGHRVGTVSDHAHRVGMAPNAAN
jgi:hypothetical protein